MKDTDREPEHDDPGAPPARRPAWVDEQAAAVAPGARRERPGRLPRQPVPGRHEEDGLWEHALVTGGLVILATWLAAVIIPYSVELWMITAAGAALTAAAGYTVLNLAGSLSVMSYFVTWGALLTGWITWARLAGPWHGRVIFALLLPALVLVPAGVTVIRRHRDRVSRAVQLGRETAQSRECRHWEDLLPRLRVHGVAIRDVIRAEGGYQVHCRLGKMGDGRQVATRDTLRELPQAIAQHKRLPTGAVYIEEEPAGGSSADFIIHVRTVTGPRLARYLPAENRVLSINRPFGLGVLGTGREFCLKLREVVVFICGLRGSGKALDVSTPIATPSGWTTMGEIQPGDYVFDESGKPCRVLAATGVMYGRPCYEIEFSDGTVITADRDHLWFVDTDASRRSLRHKLTRKPGAARSKSRDQEHLRKRPEIRTTGQMIPGLRMLRRSGATPDGGVNNYSVRVAASLQCPDADLPVPPYTLGAWLGDGHSASSRITTADPEILTEIENEGETVWIVPSTDRARVKPESAARVCLLQGSPATACSPTGKVVARRLCSNHWHVEHRAGRLDQWLTRERDTVTRARLAAYTIGGLQVRLRSIGVLGNKHIPVSYLRASEAQRRALLAGLLDTDGNCTPSGSAEFSNMNERLARDVYHLVCSLGYKATIRGKTARLNEKDCGTAWTVEFVAAEKVFRLTRKLARQVTSVRSTASHRYVTAIRRVPSRAVRCIQVDSPSQLYLAGESCVPTHNSTLLNVLTAQLARCPDALIFMIDLKGGQEARAWLMPWIQGLTDRPVIDWLATTREEAKIMLDALWLAGTARAESGKYGRKLRPSPDAPAIIVICDETAVMTGHFINEGGISNLRLAVRLVQIAETFRSVAIDPVVAAVRAVVDTTGNSGLKAMSDVRIGMRVATAHEGQQIFPDNPAAAKQLAQLKDRGMGIPQVGSELSPPVHFYNITDGTPDDDGHPTEDRITPVALAVAGRRPQPEQLVQDAMNTIRVTVSVDGRDQDMGVYDARWQLPHISQLIETWRQEAGLPDLPPRPDPGPEQDDVPGEIRDEFDALVSQDPELRSLDLGLDEGGDDEDRALHPVRRRLRELLIERGSRGYQSGMAWNLLLNEGFSVSRETVCRWLAKDEKLGYVYRTGKPRSRWVWRLPPGAEFDIPGMTD